MNYHYYVIKRGEPDFLHYYLWKYRVHGPQDFTDETLTLKGAKRSIKKHKKHLKKQFSGIVVYEEES